jgi:hypothetical protein
MTELTLRGLNFEQRVLTVLQKLEDTGFAVSIRTDISFTLHTWLTDLKISIECRSQPGPIPVAEIDQIKLVKTTLPQQTILWLVAEDPVGKNAETALRSAQITPYPIARLESIVLGIYKRAKRSNLNERRRITALSSQLRPADCREFVYKQHLAERKILSELKDILHYLPPPRNLL